MPHLARVSIPSTIIIERGKPKNGQFLIRKNDDFHLKKYRDLPKHIKWSVIDRWATNPFLVKTFADNIRKELNQFAEDKRKDVIILFSAHSIPLKVNLIFTL